MPRILIIEDEERIIDAIEKTLSMGGSYTTRSVRDPSRALAAALEDRPDLILLDIRMPGGDGRQLIKVLKEHPATRPIPVVFLTGLGSEGDKVLGLNLGADDYVVKPFGAMELLARISAVLRRTLPEAAGDGPVGGAGLVLDPQTRRAAYRGTELKLQPKEFEILLLLASRPGRPLTRRWLIENTSTYGTEVSTRSLDTHIKNLRRKLGAGARLIETLPKIGYRFAPDG